MNLQDVVAKLNKQADRMNAEEFATLQELWDAEFELSNGREKVSPDQRELVDHLLGTLDDAVQTAHDLARALAQRDAP